MTSTFWICLCYVKSISRLLISIRINVKVSKHSGILFFGGITASRFGTDIAAFHGLQQEVSTDAEVKAIIAAALIVSTISEWTASCLRDSRL